MEDQVRSELLESAGLKRRVAEQMCGEIARAIDLVVTAMRAGGKVAFCGNGGSAADAQHLAAELIGRFRRDSRPYPSIALTTDTSVLTAVGNDYGFDDVFARQVEALLDKGDVLIALSTSGNSPNCVRAVEVARRRGVTTIGMTGDSGGRLAELCDVCIAVPHTFSARIQEAHITIGHIMCGAVEDALASSEEGGA